MKCTQQRTQQRERIRQREDLYTHRREKGGGVGSVKAKYSTPLFFFFFFFETTTVWYLVVVLPIVVYKLYTFQNFFIFTRELRGIFEKNESTISANIRNHFKR